jgi:hypothetical protein
MADNPTPEEITDEAKRQAYVRRFRYNTKTHKRKPPLTLDEIEARFANREVLGWTVRGAIARMRRRRSFHLPDPNTWRDLIRAGGPLVYMRAAGLRAAKEAELEEAQRWLGWLEQNRPEVDADSHPDDITIARLVDRYIKTLRRILGEPTPIDEVRAQTRRRVRRFRERRRGGSV